MAKTILEIAQAITAELQLPIPSVALSSTDLTVKQMIALVTAACDELADGFDWQQLLSTHIWTTSNGVDLYSLPVDYLRVLSDTTWDRTNRWPMVGGMTPQSFQNLQSGTIAVAPYTRFRIAGDRVQVLPVPGSTTQTMALNYISNKYVIASNGTRKGAFTADSDTTVFKDRLLINFTKLKIMQVKGFDTSTVAADYNTSYAAATGQDNPSAGLQMFPSRRSLFGVNVPEGNWS